jgi:hypothetical protein
LKFLFEAVSFEGGGTEGWDGVCREVKGEVEVFDDCVGVDIRAEWDDGLRNVGNDM